MLLRRRPPGTTAFGADAAPRHDSGDIDTDLVDFLEVLAAATTSPQGRALLTAVASARENPELRAAADEVFTTAIERGELPPVDSSFLSEVLAGPVQLFITRRSRAFTRADAARVTGVVLAGICATRSA